VTGALPFTDAELVAPVVKLDGGASVWEVRASWRVSLTRCNSLVTRPTALGFASLGNSCVTFFSRPLKHSDCVFCKRLRNIPVLNCTASGAFQL
jgi:hypothetical protein